MGQARNSTINTIYGQDQDFLGEVVWPRLGSMAKQHDAFSCRRFKGTTPFPTKRIDK